MQVLIFSMMLAQPPVVPDGPPVVPSDPEPIAVPVVQQKPVQVPIAKDEWLVVRNSDPWGKPYTAGDLGSMPTDMRLPDVTIYRGDVAIANLYRPTAPQVLAALATAKGERQVSRTARPKGWPLPSQGETVDPDLSVAGPLPEGFDIGDMKRYKRASMTQEIAVTDGSDRITPVSRLDLHQRDNRWLVSGGLLGIDGWRSDLYRNDKAANSHEYVGNIEVENGILNRRTGKNFTQENRGWRREFADGSKFLDVLSVDGRVFEIRQRAKADGRWNNEVIYENEKARPVGYAGLNRSCASCHNARDGAGTGPYAGPLVLGSDTVFSMPFQALESRTEFRPQTERTTDESSHSVYRAPRRRLLPSLFR